MVRPYPGIVTRAVAFGVDLVIINVIAFTVTVGVGLAVAAITPGKTTVHTPAVLATAAGWLAFGAIYLVALWTLVGRTPGMRLLGIHLTCADGGRVTLWCALRRLVGMVLSFLTLGLGFLLMLFDERGRALQDRVGGTLVVGSFVVGS